jgi:hypothetical protein
MAGLLARLRSEIETRQQVDGVTAADLLELSPELCDLIRTIARGREMDLAEIAAELGARPEEARDLLDAMVEKGYLQVLEADGKRRYKASFIHTQQISAPSEVWHALED